MLCAYDPLYYTHIPLILTSRMRKKMNRLDYLEELIVKLDEAEYTIETWHSDETLVLLEYIQQLRDEIVLIIEQDDD